MLWALLRQQAQAGAKPTGGAAAPAMGGYAAPPANVPVPRGWMWGYLHSRALGHRAFGFLYVDPVGGPSFHVIADLSAPLDWAALRAAGYRGSRTARLGAYETLYLHPGTESVQWQEFEKGGVQGTVVLALPESQLGPMGLPPMPPWAYDYLPRTA